MSLTGCLKCGVVSASVVFCFSLASVEVENRNGGRERGHATNDLKPGVKLWMLWLCVSALTIRLPGRPNIGLNY